MKNENYFVGLDIGTDSVGYAVTDQRYSLCKFKGEPMWGVTLFEEAKLAVERRGYRTARRRLDRRQQRVRLIGELFAAKIAPLDPGFFCRRKESYLFPETEEKKVRIFDTLEKEKEYVAKYPTIHHLIVELMTDREPHDVRLVYLACAWLVAHRGHFLSEVDKNNVEEVTDFKGVYENLVKHLERDGKVLPWDRNEGLERMQSILRKRMPTGKKQKELLAALFDSRKAPKEINEQFEYNYDLLLKLLCGGEVSLSALFGKEEYDDLEEKKVSLGFDDVKLASILQSIGEDGDLILSLKAIYDWAVLVDVLKGHQTVSQAKVASYQQHQEDLKTLKRLIKCYAPERYDEVFRSEENPKNYVAYVGKNQVANRSSKVKKTTGEEFCKFIVSVLKSFEPKGKDRKAYEELLARAECGILLPKQVTGDNRVIPYQLYRFELCRILENAGEYLPFLREKDKDGLTGAEKILSVFEFRVPYYVGPLKENPENDKRKNCWMVRKAEGKIYPWNFDRMVDLDASENAFISRMTNSCTYLPGEDVLPKNSLVYCAFEVLNEINNLKINGEEIPVKLKQEIYNEVFLRHPKVNAKRIRDYLIANNHMEKKDVLSGVDVTVNSSLKPYLQFAKLVQGGFLSYADVERIIQRASYAEDKQRLRKWLRREFSSLPESEVKYVAGLPLKEFGRLSKKLLCGLEGCDKESGENYSSILRAMWETNCNFMQLLSDRFTFRESLEEMVKDYYALTPKTISQRLEEMGLSNAVKRPVLRTLDILKDIVKVRGRDPEMIFVEMARGATEEQKGKRTKTRLQQLYELYEKVDREDARRMHQQLERLGEEVHNKLQSDKLFLYFLQLGKCLYTGETIPLESVLAGDGVYNVEHIHPRSYVKDDSVLNNKILVDSKANGEKSDSYPVDPAVQNKMRGYWEYLHKNGLLTDEKWRRLIRTTRFTEEERFEFINRQLVETRQSTKAITVLLKERYPGAKIVTVKAGLVSQFRQEFGLPKSRVYNDLHHAKDAYLNIVTGNVWYHKFSREFWRNEAENNPKPEVVFTRPVICKGKTVWEGVPDKDRVVKIAQRNTAHLTAYSFYRKGGFFDQNPLSAAKGLIPLKKDRPTEIYGGYDSATVCGFVLVRYTVKNKRELSLVPVKLLCLKRFSESDSCALSYVAKELGEKARDIEILLNKRLIKVFTMLSLDGARFCIRGKAGLSDVGLMNMMPFVADREWERYIKKLEAFEKKGKENENIVWNEAYDGISSEKNEELFDFYLEKLSKWPFNKRPGNSVLVEKLILRRAAFSALAIGQQVKILLQVQGLVGRMKQADLKNLGESSSSGITKLSLNLSNWKKSYTDVRIVDQSASGLYETLSENLLELL